MSTEFFPTLNIFHQTLNITKNNPKMMEAKCLLKSFQKVKAKKGKEWSSKISLLDKERKGFIGQATEGRCQRQLPAAGATRCRAPPPFDGNFSSGGSGGKRRPLTQKRFLAGTAANSNLCTASRLPCLDSPPSLFLYFSHLSEEEKFCLALTQMAESWERFFFLPLTFLKSYLAYYNGASFTLLK